MEVVIHCASTHEDYRDDARVYLDLDVCLKRHLTIFPLSSDLVLQVDVISDGQVREPILTFIAAIPAGNSSRGHRRAELNAQTAEMTNACLHAHVIATFQRLKTGLADREAMTGKVVVVDIEIPDVCFDDKAFQDEVLVG
jgi:hypothetical protein